MNKKKVTDDLYKERAKFKMYKEDTPHAHGPHAHHPNEEAAGGSVHLFNVPNLAFSRVQTTQTDPSHVYRPPTSKPPGLLMCTDLGNKVRVVHTWERKHSLNRMKPER